MGSTARKVIDVTCLVYWGPGRHCAAPPTTAAEPAPKTVCPRRNTCITSVGTPNCSEDEDVCMSHVKIWEVKNHLFNKKCFLIDLARPLLEIYPKTLLAT